MINTSFLLQRLPNRPRINNDLENQCHLLVQILKWGLTVLNSHKFLMVLQEEKFHVISFKFWIIWFFFAKFFFVNRIFVRKEKLDSGEKNPNKLTICIICISKNPKIQKIYKDNIFCKLLDLTMKFLFVKTSLFFY